MKENTTRTRNPERAEGANHSNEPLRRSLAGLEKKLRAESEKIGVLASEQSEITLKDGLKIPVTLSYACRVEDSTQSNEGPYVHARLSIVESGSSIDYKSLLTRNVYLKDNEIASLDLFLFKVIEQEGQLFEARSFENVSQNYKGLDCTGSGIGRILFLSYREPLILDLARRYVQDRKNKRIYIHVIDRSDGWASTLLEAENARVSVNKRYYKSGTSRYTRIVPL